MFQSTLPTRGSDPFFPPFGAARSDVSIHAPHEGERLLLPVAAVGIDLRFNPRSPRGGATYILCHKS